MKLALEVAAAVAVLVFAYSPFILSGQISREEEKRGPWRG